MVIIIHYHKRCKQVIHPRPEFIGDVIKLVEFVTGSTIDKDSFVKKYESYEVIH